jgi:predicted component of type VI protein secretion system
MATDASKAEFLKKLREPSPARPTIPPVKPPEELPPQKSTALMPDAKAKEFLRNIYGGALPEEAFSKPPSVASAPPAPEPEAAKSPTAITESAPATEPKAKPARRRKLAELRTDERGLSLPGNKSETPIESAKRITQTANASVADLQRLVREKNSGK